jgi:hypothetical protein
MAVVYHYVMDTNCFYYAFAGCAVAATFMSLRTIPVVFLVAKDTPASMAFVA